MGPKTIKVPSKCILIFLMYLFSMVRKMWGFLVTSHNPITDNYNLANKPCFCLGLLANMTDLLRQVNDILIILGIFDTFSPPQDGIPL